MAKSLKPDAFFQTPGVILDVRSPGEYAQGHIPGSVNFPLFNNDERALVGTCYKQKGKDEAVELGLAIVGPKLANFVARAKVLAPDRQVRIHCWRGGMRSAAVGWLLETAGFNVALLIGGYKGFRRWALSLFSIPQKMIILGGMTGSGKTEILTALENIGEQVLDLEALANHRGSSFGALGQLPQPTNEQFWNAIVMEWAKFDRSQVLWVEAESKRIGMCCIPQEIFEQMERAKVISISRSRQERVAFLVEIYGEADINDLIAATERIRRRLGGLRTQEAINFLREGNLAAASDLILHYYDKTYTYDLEKRRVSIQKVDVSGFSAVDAAVLVREKSQEI
ncbi:MAG: tRNA 2-selenouridine(34) synthase MnmH [Okeania sp. SIO2G4]|uniref:tRNA 2-selenouridine(34) synthase MnmH n=1 Tax=unclassified Okeania TaxID=2634635 RepID=UPI0013BAF61D|nr:MULTISPECIES: tRNA 2-selenouridine(34) synthase MnmH [unclassified Okeania]NEP04361.1 tRNA 2-selenouridine(34) synthase MnmH [Okeania sp. SIO4D6]NEP41460.1 tRNA 2-selenouridine(34) synthase MnmH [Okeania sp. SIO2H7]NEP73257.1 tRNA 2-selenouridine(34) synthase MnmH [Okeania sp. SIO2G5]NEP94121.1 tRNA 2-selenouridine(34) synthase MnmH [Okeania sp. SIO2F5]NEQ91951.1 tRNA 2-selenouridine(34) synthase MnmH [Okeania sp. SIO2G4]